MGASSSRTSGSTPTGKTLPTPSTPAQPPVAPAPTPAPAATESTGAEMAGEKATMKQMMAEHIKKYHANQVPASTAESFAVPGIGGVSIKELIVIMLLAFVFYQVLVNKNKLWK
jgi:PAB1-binding protein PBP1